MFDFLRRLFAEDPPVEVLTPRGPRASIIIIDEGRLLLMKRVKSGKVRYVLPGGTIKSGETPAMACVRETREETGLTVWLGDKLGEFEHKGRLEHVFIASKHRGTLQLGGPELAKMSEDNQYHLLWVGPEQLLDCKLKPRALEPHCLALLSQA